MKRKNIDKIKNQKQKDVSKIHLGKRKKIFFYFVLIILPFVLISLLEFTLRLFSYGDDLSLFISASDPKYLRCNPFVGKRFFSKFDYTIPLNDLFLKEKPANAYRIFILGESTVQGFPYDPNAAFSRILNRRLNDIFPERTIEVVNLGMTAVNSYTLLDFLNEIIEQNPDLVLIYTGHNEYYGALGVASMENGSITPYFKKLHLSLVHSKTYQLLQSIIKQIYKIIYPIGKEEAKETLMQQIVGRNIIPYRSEMYEDGLIQFKNNMGELLTGLKNAGIPVIISDLVSNERDLAPFHSLKYKNFPSADSVYYLAKQREALSLFMEAKEEYLRAKDLDCIRFRASEDLNKIIFALADSLDTYKISMKYFFEKHALHGIVGSDLMTEHVHPNIDGYFLMADCFLIAIRENTLIEKNWDTTRIKSAVYYRNNWGFTKLDSTIADLRIKHLKEGWPFKPAGTINNFIFNYKPENIIDSLAFMAVKYDNINTEKLHKDLAKIYSSKGDFKNASREYLSLVYAYPYNDSYYYYASDFAGKAKDYETVIRTLKGMPYYRKNIYAQITLATAFYHEKKYNDALSSIDNALKLKLDEKELLSVQWLKYKILKDSGMNSEAEIVLASIKKLDPGFQENGEIKSRSVFIPQEIRSYIERAEVLRKNGRLKEALDILLEANSIKRNAYTDLLIGKILSLNGDPSAIYYLEKAYAEFKDDPSLSYNLALLYLMKYDFAKAETAMDEFARIKGKNNDQYNKLEMLYSRQLNKKVN